MKKGLLFCFLLISFYSLGQASINKEKDTLSLLFASENSFENFTKEKIVLQLEKIILNSLKFNEK